MPRTPTSGLCLEPGIGARTSSVYCTLYCGTRLRWQKAIRYTHAFQYHSLHHQRERRTDPTQPIIKNLAFAKQRFDSLAKRLARLVQHFDSALDVVADILRERGRASPEHAHAAQFVDIMDSEAVLQMGVLADCAELCLELTRLFDKKNVRHRFGTPNALIISNMSASLCSHGVDA